MGFYLTKPINIPIGQNVNDVVARLHNLLKIKPGELKSVALHRQSVDARDKSNVHFVCSYLVETTRAPQNAVPFKYPADVLMRTVSNPTKMHVVVVGAGPAGLFAALYLVKSGVHVTVVERGSDVDERQKIVRCFFYGGELNENTNVQFGLGGAGTFSDGKLTSGISSPLTHTVFRQLVRSGAPEDILTSSLPHVGTDRLVCVVADMRDEILHNGGEFIFNAEVTDLLLDKGSVKGVRLDNGITLSADKVVLACGHSARDTFRLLNALGAELTFKPFAVGVRVEHSRKFINLAQYGSLFATHRDLPAASYKLVMNGDTHSCYSFCMCPGGVVVAAASESDGVVVNGMSNYARNDANSNSALVVNVTAEDVASYGYGNGPFAGVNFQRELERRAFILGGGKYIAPAQNVTDFLANRTSTSFDVSPSYPRGVKSADLRTIFPEQITRTLCEGLECFDRKIRGFGTNGVLTAVESRTSSPVRIVRGDNLQSNLKNLYPVGEGAGYAGGIVSSAVDGLRIAMRIVDEI